MMYGWTFLPWTLQYLLAALIVSILSFYVYHKNPNSKTSKYFLVFGCFVIGWQVAAFLHRNAPNPELSRFIFGFVVFFSLLGISILLLTMVNILQKSKYNYLFVLPTIPIAFFLLLRQPFEIISTQNFGWSYTFTDNIVYLIILTSWGNALVIFILGILITKRHPQLKYKMLLVIIGWVFINAIGSVLANIWLVSHSASPPVGGFINIISFLIVAYGISKVSGKISVIHKYKDRKYLIDSYHKFIEKINEEIPGKELGENVAKFHDFMIAMGLEDYIENQDDNIVFNFRNLTEKDIKDLPDLILRVLKQQPILNESIKFYNVLFEETYKYLREKRKQDARDWVKDMLKRHGPYMKKFGITDLISSEIEIPDTIIEFELGKAYIIEEEKPDNVYNKLARAIMNGFEGIIITKLKPQRIQKEYTLSDVKIYQLTNKKEENNISPKKLETIHRTISSYKNSSKRIAISFDCIDQLMYANGIDKIIKFLRKLKKTCEEKDIVLLISLNPSMFTLEQLGRIEEIFK